MRPWWAEFAQCRKPGWTGRLDSRAGGRSARGIALWFTLLACCAPPACSLGGQSGDPGQLQPATGGNPSSTTGGRGSGGGPSPETGGSSGSGGGGPVYVEHCEGQDWPSPEGQRHQGSCTREGTVPVGQWQCQCDGVTRSVMSESCSGALLDGCNIDLSAPTYCAAAPAECWPGNDAGTLWRCRCAETDELREMEADSCVEALNTQCGAICEDALGVCRQDLLDPYDSGFDCGCRDSAEGTELSNLKPAIVPTGVRLSCSETLALTCRSRCANAAGYCLYSFEGGAFGCSCSDGSSASLGPDPSVTVDPLDPATFSADTCSQVLARGCGEIVYPAASTCSSSFGEATGSCEPRPNIVRAGEAVPEDVYFDCTCYSSRAADAGIPIDATGTVGPESTATVLSARSCAEALKLTCPGAIPPAPATGSEQ